MTEQVIMAGFGGQGTLTAAEVLAWAAMFEGKTTWFPEYGPAMRGGKANCTVTISDEEIGSPIAEQPDSIIIMNKPSLEFGPRVKPNGLIVLNKSLIDCEIESENVEIIEIEANAIAEKLGNPRVAAMVALGAYLEKRKIVSWDNVFKALEKVFKKESLIEINKKALEAGAEAVKSKNPTER